MECQRQIMCVLLCHAANKYCCIHGKCPLQDHNKTPRSAMLTTGRGRGRLGPLVVPIFLTPGMTPGTTAGFFMPVSNLDKLQLVSNWVLTSCPYAHGHSCAHTHTHIPVILHTLKTSIKHGNYLLSGLFSVGYSLLRYMT